MIRKIHIKNTATFGQSPEEMGALRKINFIYGSNGTGKTTISRIIADAAAYPDCPVTWQGGIALETLVYNRDFVERNFNQPDELKGIFTLGERDKEAIDKVAAAKKELASIKDSLETLKTTLEDDGNSGGKTEELKQLEEEFTEDCWKLKQQHDAKFQDAFSGFRRSKQDFKKKLLEEMTSNCAVSVPLATLEEKAQTAFGETPQPERILTVPDWKRLIGHESDPILKKIVIGKSDVDIAALIEKLGNSDWIKEGRKYYDPEGRICPFCQQKTSVSLEKSLTEYFDEAFEADSDAIERLYTEYKSASERLRQELRILLNNGSKYLDVERLRDQSALFNSKIRLNIQRIEEKQRESSKSIELDSLCDVLDAIKKLLEVANTQIQTHNTRVENVQSERSKLKEQVWRYLLDHEINSKLASYKRKKTGLEKAIANLEVKIENKIKEKSQKEQEIRALEKDTTSIQPTIDDINTLLKSFGFQGFTLTKSERDRFYKIQRSDGSDAKETLSEGERSFIAFLYFYHLVKGSASESGVASDRVVVFDDPVSSLDSSVLFVVSSLIKEIFNDVRENRGAVKQVFVLTHNAYFHKEISFNSSRSGDGRKLKDETFWTVRKSGMVSEIETHCTNPIKNTYESLWMEVRRADRYSPSLQNTLRRILEHYFKILGNVDRDTICSKFDGQEKWICRSLFSWVNEGSHFAHDDPSFSPDESMAETYLNVFKKVFEQTGNEGHYDMMTSSTANGT